MNYSTYLGWYYFSSCTFSWSLFLVSHTIINIKSVDVVTVCWFGCTINLIEVQFDKWLGFIYLQPSPQPINESKHFFILAYQYHHANVLHNSFCSVFAAHMNPCHSFVVDYICLLSDHIVGIFLQFILCSSISSSANKFSL